MGLYTVCICHFVTYISVQNFRTFTIVGLQSILFNNVQHVKRKQTEQKKKNVSEDVLRSISVLCDNSRTIFLISPYVVGTH